MDAPSVIGSSNVTEDDLTAKACAHYSGLRVRPHQYSRLVVNPDSFEQSIENLYHLSYLMRDGTCALEFTPDGEPVVCEPHSMSFVHSACSTADACEMPSKVDLSAGHTRRDCDEHIKKARVMNVNNLE
ncbi:hypothetical protein F4604DRAFT_1923010 [Suillus subluteus]|nr:hypothetical protein F4604DRAFT_1923010 [Suillus subluteus]